MDGKAPVQLQDWLNPENLTNFIDELREVGYNIGIAQYVAAQDLILALLAKGESLNQPERFKSLLAPLLCSSPTEQDDFQQRFDQWVNRLAFAVASKTAEENATATKLKRELVEIEKQSRWWQWGWLFVLGIVLMTVLGVVMVYLKSSGQQQPTVSTPSPFPLPRLPPPTLIELRTVLGVLLIPLFTFLGRRFWWRWRAERFLKRCATTQEPELKKVSIPGSDQDLFPPLLFLQIAQRFRGRIQVPSNEIDVDRTIEKTVRTGGWFTPVYRRHLVPPEYLFLIDRASYSDHQARFITEMIERLLDNGVFITAYYFNNDPRICFPTIGKEPPRKLYELAARYSQYRLVVFSEAERLFSPSTGELEPWVELFSEWNDRAVLTPKPSEHWGFQEYELSQQFMILPATPEGLYDFIRNLQYGESSFTASDKDRVPLPDTLRMRPRRWIERDSPEPLLVKKVLQSLKRFLGEDGYHWLCACAIFPELHWNLTLYLGNTLKAKDGRTLLQASQLTDMARLPWFRYGCMPDWLRLWLIAELSYQQDQDVRLALDALLVTAVQGSVSGMQLEVASKYSNSLSKVSEPLLRLLSKKASKNSPLRDYIFLDFMARQTEKLAVKLPKSLSKLLTAKQQLKVGWRFWLQWTLTTTLSSALGWTILPLLNFDVDSYTSLFIVSLAGFGAINGTVQLYILGRYGFRTGRWTKVGWVLTSMLAWLSLSFFGISGNSDFVSFLIVGGIIGGIFGVIQLPILRRFIHRNVWQYWILSRVFGDGIGWLIFPVAQLVYDFFDNERVGNITGFTTLGTGLGFSSGAITGAVLVWFLRQPVIEKQKRRR